MSLAERLRDMVNDDYEVSDVIQAFRDENWVPLQKLGFPEKKFDGVQLYLTGREWYDRFFQEVTSRTKTGVLGTADYIEAAKKAAGLDN